METQIKEQQKISVDTSKKIEYMAINWATENIEDPKLRNDFTQTVKKTLTTIIKKAYSAAKDAKVCFQSWKSCVAEMYVLETTLTEITKKAVIADVGTRGLLKLFGGQNFSFPALVQKAANKMYGKVVDYAKLTVEQQEEVMIYLFKKTGKTFETLQKFLKYASRAAYIIVFAVIAYQIYKICVSDNPVKTAVKTAFDLGFGMAGAQLGGKLGAAIGACGGPVGVVIGGIVGGVVGGISGAIIGDNVFELLYNAFYPSTVTGCGPPPILGMADLYGPPYIPCMERGELDAGAAPQGAPDIQGADSIQGAPKPW